jgi:hypothetical protein
LLYFFFPSLHGSGLLAAAVGVVVVLLPALLLLVAAAVVVASREYNNVRLVGPSRKSNARHLGFQKPAG